VAISRRLSEEIARATGIAIGPNDVLIDTPPVKLEVQFDLRVRMRDGSFRDLSELSPVVQSLATQQFDSLVKRVRVFVAPACREAVRTLDLPSLVRNALGH